MRIQTLQEQHLFFPDIDGFWNHHDLAQTERQIRSVIPSSEPPFTAIQVEALTQLARLQSLQGKFKEARATLEFCEILLQTLEPESRLRPEIRFLLESGRFFCLSMFPARALEYFSKAWSLTEKPEMDVFAIDAAYMLSITLPTKEGKKWLQTAIEIAEKSKEPISQRWLAQLYIMDGWQAFDSHDFSKAHQLFEKAETHAGQNENRNFNQSMKWSQARALRALGQNDQALKLQEVILAEMESLGESNGHVYLEIAECYQSMQESSKARPYFEFAFERLKNDIWYKDNCDQELSRIQKNAKK